MNILVTLNSGYLKQLVVMLTSLCENNNCNIELYIMHNSLKTEELKKIGEISPKLHINSVFIDDDFLKDAPTTARYPREMYFRIFACKILPQSIDKILYLDPDIVIINSLENLYNVDLGSCLIGAASHLKETGVMNKLNELRLSMHQGTSYVNSGVILFNLKEFRENLAEEEIFSFIKKYKQLLILPDQDILNGVFGYCILNINTLLYNLSDRVMVIHNVNPLNINKKISLDWVRRNTKIIHYCGRNKPWNDNYLGELDVFYKQFES
ncbi:MAG: glycosyltransferase family 8 protein, partial [Oscillospiraceae bacterium]